MGNDVISVLSARSQATDLKQWFSNSTARSSHLKSLKVPMLSSALHQGSALGWDPGISDF